jgi:hypothetical protein
MFGAGLIRLKIIFWNILNLKKNDELYDMKTEYGWSLNMNTYYI